MIDKDKTYIGIVEDNDDPKRLGRCRIRVFDVFDEVPTEDIPWASPWKDLNGNQFNLPERGKILTVIFDSGNIYKPEYICSDHYNINLENKIKKLSNSGYLSMKSLIFDHKTQIFSNDDEGLIIDYMFNNINLTKDTIDVSLKDNFGKINIGDKSADQESILGTNFLGWFDDFVDNLLGSKGGPYLGNMGSPVVASPSLISSLLQYKALKQSKFLSKNVYLNSNYQINTVRQNKDDRENSSQLGDSWRSTKVENEFTFLESNVPYNPEYGTGEEVPTVNDSSSLTSDGSGTDQSFTDESSIVGEVSPDINNIIKSMKSKNYVVNEEVDQVNIVGIRTQYIGDVYSNVFKDNIWVIWKNISGNWEGKKYPASTIPGLYKGNPNKGGIKMKKYKQEKKMGLSVLVPAQYINAYVLTEASEPPNKITSKASPYLRQSSEVKVFRDEHWDDDRIFHDKTVTGLFGIHIHRGFPGGSLVNSWSEGCQVFSKKSDYTGFISILRNHIKKYGNKFNYTLMSSADIT